MTGVDRPSVALTTLPGRRAGVDLLALFENARDLVLLNDRDGRIVLANRAAREFGGYSEADLTAGVWLKDVLPPAEYEAAMLLTERALDGLVVPPVYEREAVLRNGQRRLVELRSNVLELSNGERLLQTIGRDVTESRRAAAFQASLLQVSHALLSAQHVDDVAKLICEEARRVLEVAGVYLWLLREDDLVVAASAGLGAQQMQGMQRPIAGSFAGSILQGDRMVMLNHREDIEANVPRAKAAGIQAVLAIPLRRQGERLGILVFSHDSDPQFFAGAVSDRALILAAQTSVAIGSALARERGEEEGRVSAALLRVAKAIRESLEEAEVMERIANSACEVLGCDWALMCLWNEATGSFQVSTAAGWQSEVVDELRMVDFRPERFLELAPVAGHEATEVREPQAGHRALYERWRISSFLSVPMLRANALIGSISVGFRERRGPFSERERRITEGIAAQAAVAVDNARLVEHLRRANHLKSEFLGTMSHELRTPLSAMLGYAELLRDAVMGPLTDEQGQALDRMLINGRSLLELINTTLDVNRLEAGRVTVDLAPLKVDGLIGELEREYSARPLEPGVTLVWPTQASCLELSSDRNKLKVILRNLLDNALKFTTAGSVRLEVGMAPHGEAVRFAVRDTGVGIPADAQQSIFEMFQQLETESLPSRGGVGLGLYLVRRYTQLLGGELSVESAPGQGSAFFIDLPTATR